MNTYCERDRYADDNTHSHVSWVFFGILHASRLYSPWLTVVFWLCWLMLSVWRMLCDVVVKRHCRYTQKPTTSHVRGWQNWSGRKFWGYARTLPWEDVKSEWMPIWQEASILSGVDILATVCRDVPVNGWFRFLLLKSGVITEPQNTHTRTQMK